MTLKTQRKKSGKWNKNQEVKDKNGSLKAFYETQETLQCTFLNITATDMRKTKHCPQNPV